MSQRKTRHLKAIRSPHLDQVLLINTETNCLAWYADYASDYLRNEKAITWVHHVNCVRELYNSVKEQGGVMICL